MQHVVPLLTKLKSAVIGYYMHRPMYPYQVFCEIILVFLAAIAKLIKHQSDQKLEK